jgi:L-lactate dehydrogenase complex protein LldG
VVEGAAMSEARDAVLARIRAALRDVPAGERPEDVPVERAYRRSLDLPEAECIDRFAERVADYKVKVHRLAPGDLRDAIGRALAGRGARRIVVPVDLPEAWRPAGGSVELMPDEAMSHEHLDALDGVLTGCAVAIAETGSIVLDGGEAQGRRAISLLPDYHLCVVRADQIVDSVPEAVARLEPAVKQGRPITFISGPSATSDIELNRVEGVHGPRTLEVLIVGP